MRVEIDKIIHSSEPTVADLEGKTDFENDREMLKHVMELISQTRERIDKESDLVNSLPDSPRSPAAIPPFKGPRYFPRPPKFKE
jgi:hypothetical protein